MFGLRYYVNKTLQRIRDKDDGERGGGREEEGYRERKRRGEEGEGEGEKKGGGVQSFTIISVCYATSLNIHTHPYSRLPDEYIVDTKHCVKQLEVAIAETDPCVYVDVCV